MSVSGRDGSAERDLAAHQRALIVLRELLFPTPISDDQPPKKQPKKTKTKPSS